MAGLGRIRAGLGAVLSTLPAVMTYPRLSGVVNIPAGGVALVIGRAAGDYMQAMAGGANLYTWDLYVIASMRDEGLATDDLDPYLSAAGDRSIRTAVFANRGLGVLDEAGAVDVDAWVTGFEGYGGEFDDVEMAHLGAIVKVSTVTSGLP
jgi:hypothetical protein